MRTRFERRHRFLQLTSFFGTAGLVSVALDFEQRRQVDGDLRSKDISIQIHPGSRLFNPDSKPVLLLLLLELGELLLKLVNCPRKLPVGVGPGLNGAEGAGHFSTGPPSW